MNWDGSANFYKIWHGEFVSFTARRMKSHFAIAHDPIFESNESTQRRYKDSEISVLINTPEYVNGIWSLDDLTDFRNDCVSRQTDENLLIVQTAHVGQ